jgi:enoyl-CoA hydratase
MSQSLLIKDALPGVRVLTLNRPEKRNAINQGLFNALVAAFESLDVDQSVNVAILTGSGSAFCAGVDLADVADHALLAERRQSGVSPPAALRKVQKPVIGAINGACVAGGLELALACDFLVASEQASFADTHIQLGLLPSWGGAAMLPAVVGTARAKQIALTGLPISAAEAHIAGLVSAVVAGDDLLEAVLNVAAQVAKAPPDKVARLLEIYDSSEGQTRAERLAIERRALLESEPDVRRAQLRREALEQKSRS